MERRDKGLQEFSLEGLNALVIGGSSGIGRQIALGFSAAGARVAVAARTRSAVEAVAAQLCPGKPEAHGFVADVTAPGSIARLSDSVNHEFGRVDILCLCQGTTLLKPAEDFDEDDYERIMGLNLRSVMFGCTTFGRQMLERGSGSIITIGSVATHMGLPKAAIYAASKHAVIGLTKTLAAEWADRGVRVNAISPGFFLTDLNREKMDAERKRRVLERTPFGRFGELNELVGAAVFLASSASRFMTGSVLNVDGGYLANGI